MLSESQIDLVCSGRHGDPSTVLGLHVERGLPWLRAFLPGASQVVALDSRSGEWLAVLEQRHRDGLFEAALPTAGHTDDHTDDHTDYRLQVRWSDGSSSIDDDPYRFGLMLDESDLAQFAAGSHLRPCELLSALPRVMRLDFDPAGFEWTAPGDGRQPVLSFTGRGAADAALLVVVCNFAAIPQPHLRVGVPQAGVYTERLHTDHPRYGGPAGAPAAAERRAEPSGAHARPHSLSLTLPAFSTVIFEWRP